MVPLEPSSSGRCMSNTCGPHGRKMDDPTLIEPREGSKTNKILRLALCRRILIVRKRANAMSLRLDAPPGRG